MKLEIIEKAYELNLDRIKNEFYYSKIIVYAKTRGQAKQKIRNQIVIEDYEIKYVGKMTFLNMPIRRCKINDRVKYEGKILKRWQVEKEIKLENHNKKLDEYLSDDNITHCYIRKRGLYYDWNMSGYTSYRYRAGVYEKKEAINPCKGIIELGCIPINISEHNKILLSEIAKIKKGIISQL